MTKIRTYLLFGSALTLLFSAQPALMGGHTAQAQEVVKQPVSGWAVTRVNPEGGGASYCALARKYAPNTVLTVARNTSQESSIAIDFQRAAFNASRDLSITLDAGAGVTRLFDVRPISRSAVVLKTGRDQGFFDALADTRTLTATVNDKAYRFVMPDIEMGLSQLKNCIGEAPSLASSLSLPEDMSRGASNADAQKQRVLQNHQDGRLAALQDRLERLESENTRVQNDRTSTDTAIQTKLRRLEAEKIELAAQLEAERARYREELVSGNQELEGQLSAMEAQLAAIEADKNQQLASAKEEMQRIEAEKKNLLSANRAAMAAAQQDIDTIQAERDALSQQLEAERDKYEAKLAKGQAASSQKMEGLQLRLGELESQNLNLLNENKARQEQINAQLSELRIENETLQARLKKERDEYQKQLVSSTDQRDKKLNDLQAQLAEVEAQKQELEKSRLQEMQNLGEEQQRIAALKAELEASRAEKASLQQTMQERIARLEAEKQALEAAQRAEFGKVQGDKTKLDELAAKLEVNEAEKQALQNRMQGRIAELQDRNKQLLADQDSDRSELVQDLNALRQENAALSARLEKERENYQKTLAQKADQPDPRMQNLMDQLSLAETRNEALSEAMKSNDKATQALLSNKSGVSDEALQAAKLEQMELRSMLEAEKARRQRIEQIVNSRAGNQSLELTKQLADLKQQNESLKNQLNQKGVAAPQPEQSTAQMTAMQKALVAKDRRIASVEEEREQLMRALQEERSAFRSRLRDQAGQANEPELGQVADKLTILEKRNESLMRALQDARARSTMTPSGQTAAAAPALQAERDELRVMLQAEQARRERLEQLMASRQSMANSTSSNPRVVARPSAQQNGQNAVNARLVSDLNARVDDLQRQNQELARALTMNAKRPSNPAMAQPVIVQSDDNSAVSRELAQIKRQLSDQNAVLSSVQGERDRLASQLNALQSESVSTRQDVELRQRLRAMEQHNMDMAKRLSEKNATASQPFPRSQVGRGSLQSNDLSEVQNALEVALAERDEYQALLQRERIRMKDMQKLKTRKTTIDGDEMALNEMIRKLEAEKINLVRELEFERAGGTSQAASTANETQKMALLRQERDALRAALDAEGKALVMKKQDIEQEKETVENQIAQAEEEVETIRKQQSVYSRRLASSSLNDTAGASEVQKRDDQIASLKVQNEMLAQQVETKPVAGAVMSADMQRMQRRFEAAEQENIRLAKKLADQKAALDAAMGTPVVQAQAVTPVQEQTIRTLPATQQDIVVADNAPQSALQKLRQRIGLGARPAQQAVAAKDEIPPMGEAAPATIDAAPVVEPQIRVATNERNAQITAQPLHVQRLERPASAMKPIMDQQPQDIPVETAMDMAAVTGDQPSSDTMAIVQPRDADAPDGSVIKQLLRESGVTLSGGLQEVGQVATSEFAAFRWDTGTVYGSAEQSRIANPYLFENFMDGYLKKTASRCPGVFDSSSNSMSYVNELPVANYDIACITDENSGEGAGAAIIFFIKDGLFNVVAHEGGLDSFEEAMSTRDRISSRLLN